MTENVQDYIKKMRDASKGDDEIKIELVKAGWDEKDIPIDNSVQQPQQGKSKKKVSKSGLIIFWILGVVLTLTGGYYFLNPGDDLGALLVGMIALLILVVGLMFLGGAVIGQIRSKKNQSSDNVLSKKKNNNLIYIILVIILAIILILFFILPAPGL